MRKNTKYKGRQILEEYDNQKMMNPEEIIKFWFGKDINKDPLRNADIWFTKNDEFDMGIKVQFQPTSEKIKRGKHQDWLSTPEGSMAYILVTDQFSRNIFRNQKESFSFDELALVAAKQGVAKKLDQQLSWVERCFYYLPFEHSENLQMQEESLRLFQKLHAETPKMFLDYTDETYDYAVRHWEIIKRFGRFPHRNEILGRQSTPEEIEFLKQPGSSF